VSKKHFQDGSAELQIPPLRSPGFPVDVNGAVELHAPFPYRKAHTRPCPALRGRKSGYASVGMTKGRAALPLGFDAAEDEQQVPPLRSPGFPVELGGVDVLHAFPLQKRAHAALSSAAWQEIWVGYGRDDNSVWER
jgi:hypothetical protein